MPSYKITLNAPYWIVNAPDKETARGWIHENLSNDYGIDYGAMFSDDDPANFTIEESDEKPDSGCMYDHDHEHEPCEWYD